MRQRRIFCRQKGGVIFPKPIVELCTPELLVQTFEQGEHIQNYLSNITAIPEAARKKMSDLGADLLLSMVFQNNFVHGGINKIVDQCLSNHID